MTKLRDRFYIDDSDGLTEGDFKTLPNSFEDDSDELSLKNSLVMSAIIHPIAFFVVWALITYAVSLNFFQKPPLKPRDIEFVITQNEATPINKNTKYRSDRNSRAGGIHDPKRVVSLPSAPSKPSPKSVSSPSSTPQKTTQTKKQVTQKNNTPAKRQTTQTPKAPQKPQPVKAPSPTFKPTLKPSSAPPKTQAPKLSQVPKSPFSVAVPKSTAPVGPAPSYGSKTGSSSSGATSPSGSSKGTGMPAPQFSASKSGTSSGASRGSSGSRGSGYSGGNIGNPGPGNPSGPPGIDAIKQPNWGPYMRDLEARIKRNWNPPKGDQSKRVVLLFKIGRDGRLLSIRTVKSSGQPLSDAAAKNAVELTAPFKPLPPEFKGSSIDIEFTFDYNVLGASYR